jgi:DDE superfamily endonuclease
MDWINHFNIHTKDRVMGTHRLLILDGHGSHATPEFDAFCTENSIVTICMPPHTSHIVQPLDVGCFGALKTIYGQLVRDLCRRGILHVDKEDFLLMYLEARTRVFSEQTIKNSFRATGLVPFNPDYVLSQLFATPTPPSTSSGSLDGGLASSPWQSGTPKNLGDLAKQLGLVHTAIQHSSQSPTAVLGKVVKCTQQAMIQGTILERRVTELEATIQYQNKKRRKSSRRLQTGGVLLVGDALDMIAERQLVVEGPADESGRLPRLRATRRCSNCHQTGHNRQRCTVHQNSTS